MKRSIKIILCILMILSLFACNQIDNTEAYSTKESNMFVEIYSSKSEPYKIVYHKDSRVIWAVSNNGVFTRIDDRYGEPLLWYPSE